MEKVKELFEHAVEAGQTGVSIDSQVISISDVHEKIGFHTTLMSAARHNNVQPYVAMHLKQTKRKPHSQSSVPSGPRSALRAKIEPRPTSGWKDGPAGPSSLPGGSVKVGHNSP